MRRTQVLFVLLTFFATSSYGWGNSSRGVYHSSESQYAPVLRADSIRTLIRRGLTAEARTTLDSMIVDKEAPDYFALKASTYEKDANWNEVILNLEQAVLLRPDSVNWQKRLWVGRINLAGNDSTAKTAATEFIRREGNILAQGNSLRDCYLSMFTGGLIGDTSVTVRGDRLIELYPESKEADDLVGTRFWDGMYPIWTNDSAKIFYFHDFIQKYSRSDWALYARRNLIASYLALNDTISAFNAAKGLVYFGHDSPLVLSQAVSMMSGIPIAADSVEIWAERAYAKRKELARPSYYSEPEWALVEQVTIAGFPLTLAAMELQKIAPTTKSKSKKSILERAELYALESLTLATYDIDDHNTCAPQYLMLGRISLALGDSTAAGKWWVRCAMEGDVHNRFAGKAVDSLKTVFRLKNEREVLAFARRITGYKGITFDRVTTEVGLDSARGSRIAWGDYDRDGDDDVLAGGSKLFNNNQFVSKFLEIVETAYQIPEGCHGGVWGEYDLDGKLDLFLFSSSGVRGNSERLYQNSFGIIPGEFERLQAFQPNADSMVVNLESAAINGQYFNDITNSSPSLPDSFSTEAAIWFDANGDGRLDLYIPGYERPAKSADNLGNAWPSRLMVQDDKGVFHDSTETFGLVPMDGRWLCGRSPVACDFDRDGDQDLYIGNYRLQRNQFFINQNRGLDNTHRRFEDRADFYQVDGEEVEGWWGHTIGTQWADFDNDGDFDLIACNLAHPRYIGFSNRTMLYRNDGPGKPFVDVRREWGIRYEECHSEPVFGDFDNDGDLDLFITSVYPNRRSFLYENKGTHFEDITFLSGVRIFNGWGCATSDYDNDGKLDLAACEGGKVELFHNTTTKAGNWLEVSPDRTPGVHLSQIGGIVEVIADGKRYIRQFEGGKGAGSQNSGTLHFGLGKAKSCEVRVFNYGKTMTLEDVNANQKFEIGK